MSRRILTKTTIDELLEAGCEELQLQAGDIVTDLAREYAQQRGLRLLPAGNGLVAAAPARATTPAAPVAAQVAAPVAEQPAESPEQPAESPEQTAAEVKRAVIAALGHEPADLDTIIARVVG